MDPILHTAIALGCMVGCFYAGHFLATRNMFEPIISKMLDKLEADGFIYTTTDKDGDKELIPVSEVVAKTLRDAIKSSK
jgi:DNA-binding MarR family transcriptional regulator